MWGQYVQNLKCACAGEKSVCMCVSGCDGRAKAPSPPAPKKLYKGNEGERYLCHFAHREGDNPTFSGHWLFWDTPIISTQVVPFVWSGFSTWRYPSDWKKKKEDENLETPVQPGSEPKDFHTFWKLLFTKVFGERLFESHEVFQLALPAPAVRCYCSTGLLGQAR